jgi:hypothetical protein
MFSRRLGSRTGASMARRGPRALPLLAAGALSLLMLLSGCGTLPPMSGPPTASQIFGNSLHSKMKDAKMALTASLKSSANGIDFNLTITGDGQIVVQPTAAFQMNLNMNIASDQLNGTVVADVIQANGKLYTRTQIKIPGFLTTDMTKYMVSDAIGVQSSLLPRELGNVKMAGEEIVRGDKCWHLSGVVSVNAAGTPVPAGTRGASSVNVEEWVRESDYYVARVKLGSLPGFSLPLGGASAGAGGSSADLGFTIDLTNYDQGVSIKPPPADQIRS